jgi:hypothetical protein
MTEAEDSTLIKHLLCTAVLLLGTTALRAELFNFSYSGGTGGSAVSFTGTLSATEEGASVNYDVTDVAGTRNGTAFDDSSASGTFKYNGSASKIDLQYSISIYDYDVSSGSPATEVSSILGFCCFTTTNLATLSITDPPPPGLPEPATPVLLLTMGLGVWVLTRKLPSNKTL